VGWLPNCLPVTVVTWLYIGVPGPPGRAVVWPGRGASTSTVIRHARRGFRFGDNGQGVR
jgi:hypothetical protein